MKKLIIVLTVVFQNVFGQFPNAADLNTATNMSNTGTLSIGSNDLHWQASISGSEGPYVPAVSCGVVYYMWYVPTTINAGWISYPHTCTTGDPAEHYCLSKDMDIYYKLNLNLPAAIGGSAISTPGTYCLAFDLYADNSVADIEVNGVNKFLNTNSNQGYFLGYVPGARVTVPLCSGWKAGNNTIIIHLVSGKGTNGPTWEALLAEVNVNLTTTAIGTSSSLQNLKLYPNPSDDLIKITGILIGSNIEIVNLMGERIIVAKAVSDTLELSTAEIPCGVYYTRIFWNGGSAVWKWIRD